MSPRLPLVCGVALALAVMAFPAPAQAAATPGPAVDLTPQVAVINAAKERKQTVFSLDVAAQAGERRYLRSDLAVDKVVLPKGQPSIFLGVSIICTGPGNVTVLDVEGGTNVWTSDKDFVIPVLGAFTAKESATYACITRVMICDPGNCNSPEGLGSVTLITKPAPPKDYSYLAVSGALPAWSLIYQIPKARDTLVGPGKSLAMTKAFDFTGADGPIVVGSIVSLTNCIVADYPPVCSAAKSMSTQGSARVTIALVITQLPAIAGTQCAVIKARPVTDTITWQEHHAVADIVVPDVVLSDAPGCGRSVNVTTTVGVGKGNSVAVEGGSKRIVESVTYAVPGSPAP